MKTKKKKYNKEKPATGRPTGPCTSLGAPQREIGQTVGKPRKNQEKLRKTKEKQGKLRNFKIFKNLIRYDFPKNSVWTQNLSPGT